MCAPCHFISSMHVDLFIFSHNFAVLFFEFSITMTPFRVEAYLFRLHKFCSFLMLRIAEAHRLEVVALFVWC